MQTFISFAAAQLSAAGIFLHSESEFPKRVKISILKIFIDDEKDICRRQIRFISMIKKIFIVRLCVSGHAPIVSGATAL
jgi:hypothetical protein